MWQNYAAGCYALIAIALVVLFPKSFGSGTAAGSILGVTTLGILIYGLVTSFRIPSIKHAAVIIPFSLEEYRKHQQDSARYWRATAISLIAAIVALLGFLVKILLNR